jgi:hypothetical protein
LRRLIVDVEAGGACGLAVVSGAFFREFHTENVLAGLDRPGGELLFGWDAEEVVDVPELLVFEEERVAAEAGAVREDHALGEPTSP